MLKKLLKYDISSSYRSFLPLYGALLLSSVLLSFRSGDAFFMPGSANGFFFEILSSLYGVLIIVLMVMTASNCTRRYRQSLLGDEGYLMHTLPVTSMQLILSKVITAFVWITLSTITLIASIIILVIGAAGFSDTFEFIGIFFKEAGRAISNDIRVLWVILSAWLLVSFSYLVFLLVVYVSASLSHLPIFQKYRRLSSFGFFIAIFILINATTNFAINPMWNRLIGTSFTATSLTNIIYYILFNVAIEAVYCVALWFAANNLLSKNLNLA